MDTANEGEGDGLTRSTTASDLLVEGPHTRDSENNDSPYEEDTLQQMLTCETGNTGTKARTPPCDKETTGQGLHGTSPANDNLDKDAITLIQLEAPDEVSEIDRLAELEVTSSDESGDWETASEASVAYEETTDVKGEKKNESLDSNGNMGNYSPEEHGDGLKLQIPGGHLEETGCDGAEELAEQGCERTSSKDLQSEPAFPQGTRPTDTVHDGSLCDASKTESKEVPPYANETLREGASNEESDSNVKEMVTEDTMSHFANTDSHIEKVNDENESGTGGSVTHIEKVNDENESGAGGSVTHIEKEVMEWTMCIEEKASNIEGIEAQMEMPANGSMELQKNELGNKEAEPQVKEAPCEVGELHADEIVTHPEEAVQKCRESLEEVTDRESTVPGGNELVCIEPEPHVQEILSEQCNPPMEEAISDGTGHQNEETIGEHVTSHAEESASEIAMFSANTHEPYVKETLSGESEPYIYERDYEGTVSNDEAYVGEIVGARALINDSEENDTQTVDTISEETKSMSHHTLSAMLEGNTIIKVTNENNISSYVVEKEQGPLDTGTYKEGVDRKTETVSNEEVVDSQPIIDKGFGVDQKEIIEDCISNAITVTVNKEASSKVTSDDHKEGLSQLLDVDTESTSHNEIEGVSSEVVCQIMSGDFEDTIGTESAMEHLEGYHKETDFQVNKGQSMGTFIEDVLGNYTESVCNDGSIEVFMEETPSACEELCETLIEYTDSRDTFICPTASEVIHTIDSNYSVDETSTIDHREIPAAIKETSESENIEKPHKEIIVSFVETSEASGPTQNNDDIFIERILTEPSNEQRELAKSENLEDKELRELTEIPPNIQYQKYIAKESAAKENESGSSEDGESWHAKETLLHAPQEDIETMWMEGKSSNKNVGEKEDKAHNIEAQVMFSEDFIEEISHKSLEIDVDQPVSINDGILCMDENTNTESKSDAVEQVPLDEILNEDLEEYELNKHQSLNDTETNILPGMLVKPLPMRPVVFSNDSFQNLNEAPEPVEPYIQNFQVADGAKSADDYHHQVIPDQEQSSPVEETLSTYLHIETIEDQEQIQGDIQVGKIMGPQSRIHFLEGQKELTEDEPDCFNQGLIFDREIGAFLPTTEPITKPATDIQETMLTVAAQPGLEDLTISHGEPVVGYQSKLDLNQKTGQHAEGTAIDSLPLLITRKRSNTDPCLSYDQGEEEDGTQQVDQREKEKPRPRLRSATPPLDSFTASFTAPSPQATPESKPLEKTQTSVVYPAVDYNISEEQKAEEATPKKDFTFFPTQIFNPLFFIQEGLEKHGFYQDKPLLSHVTENTNKRRLPPLPTDTEVLLQVQQPTTISGPGRSSRETIETSAINPSAANPVAPVWLPPRPIRHSESSVGKDFRPLKPTENHLVRRPTVRHKKNTSPALKPSSIGKLSPIPQEVPSGDKSSVEKSFKSSTTRPLPRQVKDNAQNIGQPKNKSPMERLAEAEESSRKSSRSPEAVLRQSKRSEIQPPKFDTKHQSIHRRYSNLIHSYSLLYQEYSDVALNQEIQRQKPGDSPAEEKDPGSPRQRRRILSSQDSYLQRLSISSADSLWQDLPKIRDSVTFMSMSREEQKLQEAKFELIMSEALYLRSLNIAVDHFQRSTGLQDVLSAQDRQWLFSRLSEVRDASNDFLFDLEEEFENNMYNFQVCDVVISHEPNFRKVYLPYVTNQSYQDRTFQRLMNGNPRFQHVLSKLESDPVCQRLSLKSFLILPFQRITRLRLLLQNILKRSAPGSNEEFQATEAHNAIEKLIRDCNEGVQKMKDTEELILLHQKIQFECKIFPLISASRRLVKHGEVTSLEFNPISFKWKGTTRQVYLHLFSDCLLLSRIREGGRFVVFDHASDFRVERCEIKLHSNQKNIFRVFLKDSAATQTRDGYLDGQEMQYIFRTETQSQKLRWIYALSPPKEEIDFLKDGLTQVQCLKSYKARENDEMSLEKADILMVTQNSDDGWLCGIRLSDLHSGWFLQCHVQAISRNACLRNLQEEQRLQNARAKLHPTGAK